MNININSSQHKSDDFEKDDDFREKEESKQKRGDNDKTNRSKNRVSDSSRGERNKTKTLRNQRSTVSLKATGNTVKASVDLDVLESTPIPEKMKSSVSAEAEKPSLPEAKPDQKNVQETVKEAQKRPVQTSSKRNPSIA